MNFLQIAARIIHSGSPESKTEAPKTRNEFLKALNIRLHDLEETILRTRKSIIELHTRRGKIPYDQWVEQMQGLISHISYLKKCYDAVELLSHRIISEPANKELLKIMIP